jgi:hypothetical protein
MTDHGGPDDDRAIRALEEIARWIRFLGWKGAKEAVLENLKTDDELSIYALSDGRSTRDIGKLLSIDHKKVARRWTEWFALGLMKDGKYPGRKIALFTLVELGLPIPEKARSVSTLGPDTAEDKDTEDKSNKSPDQISQHADQ